MTHAFRRDWDKVNPYDSSINDYTRQNMLEYMLDFPEWFYQGDFVDGIWSDRLPGHPNYDAATKKHGNLSIRQEDQETTRNYLIDLTGEKLTGVQVVRHTNRASAFPVWIINVFARKTDFPAAPTHSGKIPLGAVQKVRMAQNGDLYSEYVVE